MRTPLQVFVVEFVQATGENTVAGFRCVILNMEKPAAEFSPAAGSSSSVDSI